MKLELVRVEIGGLVHTMALPVKEVVEQDDPDDGDPRRWWNPFYSRASRGDQPRH